MNDKTFAQMFIDTIHSVEQRCMAADGPVTPTCKEITDDELRKLYRAAEQAVAGIPDAQMVHTPQGICEAIELGLRRGYTPAELLDENSPIRDRIRVVAARFISSVLPATPPQEPNPITSAAQKEEGENAAGVGERDAG